MKKIISLCLSLLLLLSALPVSAASDNYYIVTAYYSPLPDQDYYITGNYEDELILNGQGIAGASGKSVFSGMLAAPGGYAFGTKIYLDGLGIGSVEDRGGAIVPAGQRGYSYDRIDVWMGYGDEGLLRANFWGKRKVYGYIVDSGNQTSLNYENIPAPKWATAGLKKQVHAAALPHIFDVSLARGSDALLISKMQDIFIELGYEIENTGIYDDATISTIYDFQIEHSIVAGEYEQGAGSYGPKTRNKLKEIYTVYQEEKKKKDAFLANISHIEQELQENTQQYIASLGIPSYGDTSYEVRELQKTLTGLGYFTHKDTAIFGNITKAALLEYQLEAEIVTSENTLGAGTFGPRTRDSIAADLAEMQLQEYLESEGLEQLYSEYKNNI